MKSTFISRIAFLIILLFGKFVLVAQNTLPSAPGSDTLRLIQILQGNSLREKTIDSLTSLQTIAGNVILKEGLTIFHCDSASINKRTNVLEAFGNIHINQNDSIHSYSQYLKYIGKERMAYLKKEVRLTDNKGTLYTQELEYDLKSSLGKYFKGGRVVNGKTILTSTEGIYYAGTKDVFFKKNVHLVDPKYDMRNDTLLYNTQTQITSWSTPTTIRSKNGGDIYSTNGTYDLKSGKAFFGNRTIIKDSTRTYLADNSAYDEATGIAQLEGNAIVKDSANGYSVLGRQIFLDKNNNSFLATGKPVLIFKGEGKDSTFIAADTLFSGVERRDSLGRKIIVSKNTIKSATVVNLQDTAAGSLVLRDSARNKSLAGNEQLKDSASMLADSAAAGKDSMANNLSVEHQAVKNPVFATAPDSLHSVDHVKDSAGYIAAGKKERATDKNALIRNKRQIRDSINGRQPVTGIDYQDKNDSSTNAARVKKDGSLAGPSQVKPAPLDSAVRLSTDSLLAGKSIMDSLGSASAGPSAARKDSLNDTTAVRVLKDTAIRYFIAFHNVRIFNDSLQSVCDSLYYSSEDSIFRLFRDPLVFANNSQIAGDTIYMYTKNKKPARLYVFENGIVINKANEKMYNQVAGRTINGHFKLGELDYVRAKGSPAESVYYPQDDDSAYVGMNRSKGDVIDVYFVNKAVNKVKLINNVDGTLFPIRQIPADQQFLKNYKWQDQRRPKNKLELFE